MTQTQELPYTLDLDQVLGVYRTALGSRTLFTNGFIQEVKPSRNGTACITKNGVFYYNPYFFQRWITTPARLTDICLHEMMHPIIGDMTREFDEVSNIAGDAIINAMLFNLGLAQCEFQQDYYPSKDVPHSLLRPYSHPPADFVPLYAALYPSTVADTPEIVVNPLEFGNALRILFDQMQGLDVTNFWEWLLGSHYRGEGDGDQLIDWEGNIIVLDDASLPGEVAGDLADQMEEIAVQHVDRVGGGRSNVLMDMTLSVLKGKRSLRTEVIKGFASNNTLNKLKQYFKAIKTRKSVIPLKITRSQAMQIAAKQPPLFYRANTKKDEDLAKQGLDFYVDVSGSVMDALPFIIALFKKLERDIRTVKVFSNMVAEIPAKQFCRGEFPTTGGTDFDCVIEDAVKNRVRKCLVITDGCADASEENQRLAVQHIERMGVVFFGGYRAEKNWISMRYGHSYELEDLLA